MNDDRIGPGGLFPPHPHADMEIFSYVPEGALEHKDNLGNTSQVGNNRVQLMSAGRGIVHSEGNPSDTETTHLYQIWITPEKRGLQPNYQEFEIDDQARDGKWLLLASHDGREGSMIIRQKIDIQNSTLKADQSLRLPMDTYHKSWLQVVSGHIKLGSEILHAGDGLAIEKEAEVRVHALEDTDLLLFSMS